MLSEAQLKTAWEEWLSAEMRANYFADLCGTFTRRQRWATWATLVLSSGAAGAFFAKFQWAVPVLAFLAAVVSLYSLVAQNPKSAAECADLHGRWNKLAMEYEALWQSWFVDDAASKLAQLNDRRADVSKSSTGYHYDEKRMLKWYDLVVRHRAPAAA